MTRIECEHGSLKRQCRLCELEAELFAMNANFQACNDERKRERELRVRFQGEVDTLKAKLNSAEKWIALARVTLRELGSDL